MKAKIKIINGEKYVPVNSNLARLLQSANVVLYSIDNSKTLYTKVNNKNS